jgi:hypothetical protein
MENVSTDGGTHPIAAAKVAAQPIQGLCFVISLQAIKLKHSDTRIRF